MDQSIETRMDGRISDLNKDKGYILVQRRDTEKTGIHIPLPHIHLLNGLKIGSRVSIIISKGEGANKSVKTIFTYPTP